MPERLTTATRAAPAGANPPVGQAQHSFPPALPTRTSGLPPRTCLRKGCGRIFPPQCWNQRYCQDPECLKLVRRWQAAKRQRQRRSRPEVREARAAATRQRRARDREQCGAAGADAETTPDRQETGPAWSRSEKNLAPFCDRPGCYEALRPSSRCAARYCGDECRQALRRVRDREWKWLRRQTAAGRFKRRLEYAARRAARREAAASVPPHARNPLVSERSDAVVTYEAPRQAALSCGDPQELPAHVADPETFARPRPRAPPSA